MSRAYAQPRSAYFVVERDGVVEGGGGIAPLEGGDADTCELRKMYFLPQLRGLGAGARVMATCLDAARAFGFSRCYLETLGGMDAAHAAVRTHRLHSASPSPMGDTGHGGCNTFYLLEL